MGMSSCYSIKPKEVSSGGLSGSKKLIFGCLDTEWEREPNKSLSTNHFVKEKGW